MNARRDITSLGWIVISVILIIDGLRTVIGGKIYGKVRMSGAAPLEGWYVHGLGAVELAAGMYLFYRLLLRRAK